MSNGQSPPPVPPAPQGSAPPPPPASSAPPSPPSAGSSFGGSAGGSASSGLPTWAKVAIGCGCLTLLIVAALIATVGFGVKKGVDKLKEEGVDVGGALEAMRDAENNPSAAVEAIINLNPGLDVVENDPDSGRITIRNTETGEEGTFDYSEIKSGKFSFDTAEGSYSMDASKAEESGSITFAGPDGETARIGTGSQDVPAWVPRYPNVLGELAGYTNVSGDTAAGLVSVESADTLEDIEAWFTEKLESEGFTLERSSMDFSGNRQVVLTGKKEGIDTLSVMIGREKDAEKSTVAVTYSGPIE